MSAMPTPENNLPIDMRHDGLDPIQHDRRTSALAILEDVQGLC
jgi:hypothetical protein